MISYRTIASNFALLATLLSLASCPSGVSDRARTDGVEPLAKVYSTADSFDSLISVIEKEAPFAHLNKIEELPLRSPSLLRASMRAASLMTPALVYLTHDRPPYNKFIVICIMHSLPDTAYYRFARGAVSSFINKEIKVAHISDSITGNSDAVKSLLIKPAPLFLGEWALYELLFPQPKIEDKSDLLSGQIHLDSVRYRYQQVVDCEFISEGLKVEIRKLLKTPRKSANSLSKL